MGSKQSFPITTDKKSEAATCETNYNKKLTKRKRKIKCNELAVAVKEENSIKLNNTKKKRFQSANMTPASVATSTTSTTCRLFANILSIKSLQQSERGSYLAAFFRLFGNIIFLHFLHFSSWCVCII